ncbi:MAG: 1-acyl-sn-glycerol-3-phosphate acyltransferase [bacterium]|nr:1-acyl-sn-glycerol-3-phosphate acyltransferase [bacterium]
MKKHPKKDLLAREIDKSMDKNCAELDRKLDHQFQNLNQKISQAIRQAGKTRSSQGGNEDRVARIITQLDQSLKHLEELDARVKGAEKNNEKEPGALSLVRKYRQGNPVRDYIRKIRMAGTSEEVDDFGYDPVFWDMVEPVFEFLYKKYWRITTIGIENIPYSGPALLVSNHSGMLPYDGGMISFAVLKEHPANRKARFLAEDFVSRMPMVAPFIAKWGMPRACPENAERLLRQGELVGVFPEGLKGIGKEFRYRYRVQRFGRGGTIRLLVRTKSPAIPVAVVGAEEIHPIIARADFISRFTGIPITPIPASLIPLPTKWTIRFGEPIHYDQYTEKDLEDEILVNQLNEELRAKVQSMILEGLKKRRSIFFG